MVWQQPKQSMLIAYSNAPIQSDSTGPPVGESLNPQSIHMNAKHHQQCTGSLSIATAPGQITTSAGCIAWSGDFQIRHPIRVHFGCLPAGLACPKLVDESFDLEIRCKSDFDRVVSLRVQLARVIRRAATDVPGRGHFRMQLGQADSKMVRKQKKNAIPPQVRRNGIADAVFSFAPSLSLSLHSGLVNNWPVDAAYLN